MSAEEPDKKQKQETSAREPEQERDDDDRNDDDDRAESEDDFSDDEEESSVVDLGFVDVPLNPRQLLRHHFPCKVGGKPAWLNPRDLPSNESLTCKACKQPLRFLLQLYASRASVRDDLFHRSLFVFVCNKSGCLANNGGCIKVFRSQLARENPFYSSEPPPELDETEADDENEGKDMVFFEDIPYTKGPVLCVVCGIRGPKGCGKCKRVRYCSKHHQRIHWRNGHSKECKETSSDSDGSGDGYDGVIFKEEKLVQMIDCGVTFPQLEIIIDEEGYDNEEDKEDENKKANAMFKKYKEEMAGLTEQEREQADKESNLEDKDMARKKDRCFLAFQVRTNRNPGQVIRYVSDEVPDSQPLWVTSKARLTPDSVPVCERCGSRRRFEFQIMPQLLNHLNLDTSDANALDWGTLAVYTCEKSCGDGEKGYADEFCYVQQIENDFSM